ncbi:MAG: hypothetical protein Q8P88_02755 [Candidatus Jorgensenbacteria bacterium]|nr:hypothetical protein [Candidatus Jorgensenbacteria bacterium]
MKKVLIVSIIALPLFAACDRTADFEFAYTNRDSTSIAAQVNGNEYGIDIAPGNSRSFTVELEILESSPTGPRTADVAYVTLAARSSQRGRISRPHPMTVYSDRVNHFSVEPHDFR